MAADKIDELRRELEEKELRHKLAGLDKEPEMVPVRKSTSKEDHTVSLNTSVAMQKALASKILGREIPIQTDDWTTMTALVSISVVGDTVSDETGLPDNHRLYRM